MLFHDAHNSMIFKTMSDEATGATKSISIFNSTASTIYRNLKSGQGVSYSIFGGNQLKNSDIDAIENYISGIKSGLSPAKSWRTHLSSCSVAAKKYVLDAKKAGKSTEELAMNLSQIPKVSKASQTALKGIAIAGNMLAMMAIGEAISLTIKGIDYLVHYEEKQAEAFKKASESTRRPFPEGGNVGYRFQSKKLIF